MKIIRSTRIIRFALLGLLFVPLYAGAWDRGEATTFATLPPGGTHPEGITVGPHGKFYVSTFAVGGTDSGVGEIFVFSPSGSFLRKIAVDVVPPADPSSTLLLELAFHPMTGELLVIDFGTQRVLKVNPYNGMSEVFTTIPGGAAAGPNVLTFDSAGNVYISDSFQGIIWRTDQNGDGAAPGTPDNWAQSSLLTTMGVPPFGANGLAFNKAEDTLFVANTGNDTVVKIPVDPDNGSAGTPEVFVNSVNGADGLIIDKNDNLWIAANQEDEIVVLEPEEGRVIAKLGDFDGIEHGKAKGLLFPASLIRYGKYIYVTNLALDLSAALGIPPPIDAPWAAEVTKFTVSKILAEIPPVAGYSSGHHRYHYKKYH